MMGSVTKVNSDKVKYISDSIGVSIVTCDKFNRMCHATSTP